MGGGWARGRARKKESNGTLWALLTQRSLKNPLSAASSAVDSRMGDSALLPTLRTYSQAGGRGGSAWGVQSGQEWIWVT